MKPLFTAMSVALLLATAACAGNNTRPTDTGNMAYPAPQPQGTIGSSNSNGAVRTGPMGADTGNMALPSRAQGNSLPR